MFTINGCTWHIKFVNPNNKILKRSNNTYSVGVTDDATKTIYLSKQIYGKFLKKVLTHEITHCAMFSYNVKLSLEQEEIVADIISTYGSQIIRITNNIFSKMCKY